eukprot:scaffold56554_cov64-Phaeocystis_antarctica.AAC.6
MPVFAQAPRGALHFFSFSLSAGLGTVACHRFPRFAAVVSRVSTRGVLSLASMCTRNEYAVITCGALQGSVHSGALCGPTSVYGPVRGLALGRLSGARSRVGRPKSRTEPRERNRFVNITLHTAQLSPH